MTDPRDPRDPPPDAPEHHPSLPERLGHLERGVEHTVERVGEAVERAEQRVEHAAEEVAEELAEHVPEPIRGPLRWTVKRLVLVSGLAVALVVVVGAGIAAYYVWNHTQWAAHELTGRVNRVLTTRSDVELTVAGVRGNPLSAVEVVEPRVRFRGQGGPVLLEARAMRLRYSTWALFVARRGALMIELDRPIVHLVRGQDGRLRVPTWQSAPSRRGRARRYDFVVRIRDGNVRLPEPAQSIEGFDLDADVATGGPTRLEIRSLRWVRGPYGMALQRFRGGLSAADSVRLEVRELVSPDLALSGTARWGRDGGPRLVEGTIQRVRWAWLAKVFRNATLDVPGEGRFEVSAREDQGRGWSGRTRGHARWNDLTLDPEGGFTWRSGRLVVDGLAGRSAAGELSGGRLVWSKQGWEIGGNATGADPAHWGVIGLKGWPAGSLQGRFRYAVDTRGRPAARLDARLVASEWAGWRADSATVAITFPPASPDSFRVLARRRGGELALAGRTANGGWTGTYQVSRFPLDEWPDGRATGLAGTLAGGEGTVESKAGALFVTGTLEGRSTRWFGAESARWWLEDVRGRLLPAPDLEARARLEDLVYLGIHFDSAAAPVHLGDRVLAFPALQAWAGDTVVTMTAGADWTARSWRLVATRAEARSGQFGWVAEPPLQLSGDASGVTFDRLEAADGDARLRVSGRWAVPGGSYDWRATGRNLRLDRLGLPPELGLRGVADAELAVTGASGDPRWDFRGSARAPALRGHQADSLEIHLAGAPSRLEVPELRLRVNDGQFRADGGVDRIANPWPDSLSADGLVRWLAGAARWHGRARAQALPLDRLARLAGSEPGWSGRLDGELELAGRPDHPEMTLRVEARPIAWRNLRVDEVAARAEYRDERLRLIQLRMTRELAVSDVSGEIDLKLGLGRAPEVLDAPMRWRVDLPNGDLGLIPLLVPQIGSATGRFEVDGEVRGTPRRPQLIGSARIHDGRVRIAGREEVLEKVRADFRFDASRITLDSLTAVQRSRQGEAGRVNGHGVVDLKEGAGPSYRFELSLRDFTAVESGLYAARFDGDFRIVDGVRVGGQVLPHVTSDDVEIRRAVVLYDFARQTEQQQVQASTQPLYWTYRIQAHANDNLRWQPPDGDIEFSADLSLEQTPEKLIIFGDMDALRGSYYFLSNRFAVQRAKLTFDDVGGVDPLLDAEASTRLVPAQPISNGPGGTVVESQRPHTITVTIQGRSSRPTVAFSDEPSNPNDPILDQAQILQELTVGRFVQGQKVALSDPFDSYLTRAISRQLSAELSRAFRGYLSEWEIARESGGLLGQGGLVVRVGSQLNDRLAVRYGQRLPGTGRTSPEGANQALVERDIEAEYRINRFFYITSQLIQKRSAAGTASSTTGAPDFNVNLKARWEY